MQKSYSKKEKLTFFITLLSQKLLKKPIIDKLEV